MQDTSGTIITQLTAFHGLLNAERNTNGNPIPRVILTSNYIIAENGRVLQAHMFICGYIC